MNIHRSRKIIRGWILAFLIFLMLALFPIRGMAQDANPEFRLNVKRNFGFSSGSQIKGNFTNSIVGPTDTIQSVTYLIDGQEMASVTQPPFSFKYETTDYAFGWHELSARVSTLDGRTAETPVRRFQFVSSEEEFATMRQIILPLLGGIFLLMLVGMGVQMLFLRDRSASLAPGTPRQYGLSGGTICPRCGRPYALHFWGLKLVLGRLDRCDYCGKWAFVRRVPVDILRAAEQAELASSQPETPARTNQEDETRRLLDESRYIDPK